MTERMVKLDKNVIFPTGYPRKESSINVGRVTRLEDLSLWDIMVDDIDGLLFVFEGNHRVGRALELAEGQEIPLDVERVSFQRKAEILAFQDKMANNGIRNYPDFIQRMQQLRKEK
ncbi:MAG: hypothetical protein US68_C0010G0028 [Candidatus Shapirobacteria bacterium GW2011_GWE1_38_10]|uniref:ParB/Sulfiredoxin domain-containing protein n=1 Tax=Candidatus Shapirobacteria bacterium GW2011_GWE1_38_10 TaxID=1618488 RepID=A0A0G0KL33_9BACT|nr:MAG: hypothetical protein US46_C0008G0051 [Candidatus Shapirobacteria bacterium GW2011_GWF2_37_20]KKQ49894.1 MAG: hypothetical protein US68_C0010G0028 [Candidatus Shapirobacteria bacterium GW2011_GWE1_38_10]KKQ64192.1 MAG: hypothetical protein US85_C0012G0024 [Candidatus Shapirobacteria bacterium GW2011_GWF1_38_23]HBP51563.1 hypothetical protein [Candidatus Shapirobacteria bacterium]